jgi:hypothetical protein
MALDDTCVYRGLGAKRSTILRDLPVPSLCVFRTVSRRERHSVGTVEPLMAARQQAIVRLSTIADLLRRR